jgi:hypothetical protein
MEVIEQEIKRLSLVANAAHKILEECPETDRPKFQAEYDAACVRLANAKLGRDS